ncbi:MAG: type II toxin-antitoxin system Phd/YefM family antitoxin [Bacteroidota bacterium]
MQPVRLSQDIRPLSEFSARASALVAGLRASQRPLVLTEDGTSAAVVLDVHAYDALLDELALLRDLHAAAQELDEGGGLSHADAKAHLRARLGR